jgi:hypothetical protein
MKAGERDDLAGGVGFSFGDAVDNDALAGRTMDTNTITTKEAGARYFRKLVLHTKLTTTLHMHISLASSASSFQRW